MLFRNLLLIIGASAIALGILIAGFLWLRPKAVERPGAPAAVSRTVVLVAARPIGAGELLRDEDISWRQIVGPTPVGSLRQDQVSRPQMLGAVTRVDLAQGEIITEGAVIRKTDQKFLAAVLSPGLRAVTIDVDASQSAAGLILPDDRVDAILVQNATDGAAPGSGASGRSVAVLLLQDVRVIAVDRLIDRPPTPTATADGKAPSGVAASTAESPPKTMTLEVTERDAQRLLLAAQIGKVDLALRALARERGPLVGTAWGLDSAVYPSDVSPLRATPALMSATAFGAPAPGLASPSAAPASQPPIPRGLAPIRILRGTKEGP